MTGWFDRIMNRRASALSRRLQPWIPTGSRIADIGSGTGHNAEAWRARFDVTVDEFDVADLHWVGSGPALFDGRRLPVDKHSYDIVTVLFVLNYSPAVLELLTEVRRISRGRVLLLQSTYQGYWGLFWLRVRDLCWGPIAFHLARLCGIIRGQSCPLIAQQLFTLYELQELLRKAQFRISHIDSQWTPGLWISRHLLVLEPDNL